MVRISRMGTFSASRFCNTLCSVVSVTSFSELARDGVACEQRMLAGDASPGTPWLAQVLEGSQGPVIAATDYVRAVPETVRAFVPEGRRYLTLGTDGEPLFCVAVPAVDDKNVGTRLLLGPALVLDARL